MEFHFSEPQSPIERLFGGHFHINAVGRIEPHDDEKFRVFLERTAPPPRLTIYVNSPGGDVDAAIGIGRLIRGSWFATSIGSYVFEAESHSEVIAERKLHPGQCLSAATLVYLGGRLRYFSARSEFGVHQFSFLNPAPEDVSRSQQLSARIAKYVEEMGISADFLEVSSNTPSHEITTLSKRELQELGVVTGGQTEAKWSVQARNHMMYVRGERDSLFGHHKVMLGYMRDAGFCFWAVIEAQGREEELTSFGCVEIVVNGEDTRIDVSNRCERVISEIYVNVLAFIEENEAKTIACSDSFGVQIRFSTEAELFLGVAAVSTDGGKEQLVNFFNTLCDGSTI